MEQVVKLVQMSLVSQEQGLLLLLVVQLAQDLLILVLLCLR